MKKKKHKDYFGKLRIPTPPPSYPQTTKKGAKGYVRENSKKISKEELDDFFDDIIDFYSEEL